MFQPVGSLLTNDEDVNVKSNTGLLWQEQLLIRRRLKFNEETSQTAHLTLSFVWCCKLDTSESRSERSWKF